MARYCTGLAGEHLVIYDLLRQGIPAFLAGPNLRYDVVADVEGQLVRIQVKSTTVKRRNHAHKLHIKPSYIFRIKDGSQKKYQPGSFDILALVALDAESIAYLPSNEFHNRAQFSFQSRDFLSHSFKKAYGQFRHLLHAHQNAGISIRAKSQK